MFLVSAACCAGQLYCNTMCTICRLCGTPRKAFARIAYIFFDVAFIGVALILMFFGPKLFSSFSWWTCPGNESQESINVCLGVTAVFRMSFSLVVLHFLMFIICLIKSSVTAALNDGAWLLKVIIVIAMFVGSMFIPNDFFKYYGYACMGVSFLFIIFQLISLIGLAYAWNSKLVESYDTTESVCSQRCWGVMMIFLTVLFYGGGLCLMIYCFFQKIYQTKTSVIFISLTLALGVVYTALTLIFRKSILTSAILFLCSSFICWSAIIGNPYQTKVISPNPNLDTFLQIFVGLVFALVALFYTSASTVVEGESEQTKTLIEKTSDAVAEKVEKEDKDNAKEKTPQETPPPEVTLHSALFNLLLMLASFYYAMLITNWGTPNIKGSSTDFFASSSKFSFWIKLVSEWVVVLLFIWSIIASAVCKSREFE